MGCRRPAQVRHVYAGADALAVDEVVLADLGIDDPTRAPIVRRAHHWFGAPALAPDRRRGADRLHDELRGAHRSVALRALGTLSYPVYVYLSNHGEVFVPEMDTVAFPPSGRTGAMTRAVRWRRNAPSGCGRRPRSALGRVPGRAPSPGRVKGRRGVATALAIAGQPPVRPGLFLSSAVSPAWLPSMRTPAFGEPWPRAAGSSRPAQGLARRGRRARQALCRRGDRYVAAGAVPGCSFGARPPSGCSPRTTARCSSTSRARMQSWPTCSAKRRSRDATIWSGTTHDRRGLPRGRAVHRPFRSCAGPSSTRGPSAPSTSAAGPGCTYAALPGADPRLGVEGIELAVSARGPGTDTAERLRADGLSHRAAVHVGDVRALAPSSGRGFDLVTLCNSVYYFPRERARGALPTSGRPACGRRSPPRHHDDVAGLGGKRTPAPHVALPVRVGRASRQRRGRR